MPPSKKQDVNLPFPINGVFESRPYDQQPERTTTDSKNVVSFDVGEDKQRGGQRLGITKATPATNEGGGLGDARVQLVEVVPIGNEAIGFPGGVINYNNSSEDGVPDGTPCNLSLLATDPNQDGQVDDVLGDLEPAPITGNATNFPIPLFESTSLTPKPTSANYTDNQYESGVGPSGTQQSIIPVGENGPVNTWNNSSPGLWHVKTCDDRKGCIYPKAPFDKNFIVNGYTYPLVDGLLEGTRMGNRAPSFLILGSNEIGKLPLGMFGGGTYSNPTQTTYVSSVLLPTQSETEDSFNSSISNNWCVTCDICTVASDTLGGRFYSSYRPPAGGEYALEARLSGSREYYYGFVFKVKAVVSHEATTIDSDSESDRCLFVGFHQAATTGNSEQAKLVIGSIDNTDNNQMSLTNTRTIDTALNDENTLDRKTWYSLDLRFVNNFLEVRLDGAGPLPDANDITVTKFNLVDFIDDDVAGDTFETSRSRSGLLFWRSSTAGIGSVDVGVSQQVPTEFNIKLEAYTRYASSQSGSDFGLGFQQVGGNFISDPDFKDNFGGTREFWASTSDNDNRNETWHFSEDASQTSGGTGARGFIGIQAHSLSSWNGSGSANLKLFMKDVGRSVSYPTSFSEDGYTQGTFASLKHVSRASQLLSRAEWGGDYIRDWNEPYFHNYQWRNISDLGDVDRVVLAATEGNVYVSSNSGSSFSQSIKDDANPNDTENIVFNPETSRISGVEYFNQFYMCDGTKYLVLDVPTRTLKDWSILCKALDNNDDPVGDPNIPGGSNAEDDAKCSLITRHMGRLVLSGYGPFPNNWFMSDYYTDSIEVGHGPNNWDVTNGAVAGTSTGLPEIGEPIKAMFPFREEALVFGCLNSISLLQGDPGDENSNSTITSISRDIGIIGPDAWAHGPNRSLFFFGTNGLYYLSPNEFNVSQTNRLSVGRMDREFASIDLAKFDVKLVYDYYLYGLHIFMSPKQNASGSTKHYFYDERSQAMWPMEYPESVGPAACAYYPDPSPANRRVLLGGYDGHIRYFDPLATSDDGAAIDSYVWIGPFQVGPVTESKVMRIAAVLDAQSPNINWGIYVGDTAEEAKSSTPVVTGEWKSGRNLWKHVRARGQNIYVKIFSNTSTALPWSLENITATLAVAGRVRERN